MKKNTTQWQNLFFERHLLLYRLLWILLFPLILSWTIYIAIKNGGVVYFKQRFGFGVKTYAKNNHNIWFHAASVGECNALMPLLQKFSKKNNIILTCNTPTAYNLMQQKLKNIGVCYYLPLDLIGPLESFIKKIQPTICIIFETEIWGNLSAVLNRKNIKYIYINGRLSKKTINANFIIKQSYQYSLQNCHYIFCRNNEDLKNFIKLGSPKNNTKVMGNLKYGFVAKKDNLTEIKFNKPVIAFVSTHEDEELQLGKIWQQNPDLHKYLLLIAPRYPHRADSIQTQLNNFDLNLKTRSKNEKIAENTHIYLADTLGELANWFHYAKIIIIGGSFITTRGGQNFTEAAGFNKPIICGPYMANFTEDVNFFKSQNAIIQCSNITDITNIIKNYEQNNKVFKTIGQNAYKIMQDNRHIIDEYYQAIQSIC
ncbi:MAG: hypothetical protein DRQ51_07275 [Gammaproteobacteria bacterium]|nr:MAG: hypothetical protein DRQ51_07275 [Gammaproteobacteria bacterium]